MMPREMLEMKKLKPEEQRQKLQAVAAQFEADAEPDFVLHQACEQGQATAAAAMLALAPGTGQLVRDHVGLLPVDHALLNGHRSAAAVALRGVPLEELNVLSLLLLPLLLQTGNLDPPQQASLDAGLRAAAAGGREPAVRLLLEHSAAPDTMQEDGATALMLACRPGHLPVVRRLLTARASPNGVAGRSRRPLHVAAEAGNVALVNVLLEHRADVEAATLKTGSSPLLLASRQGHLECMKALLEAQAQVTSASNAAKSPLLAAIGASSPEPVRLLLEARASPATAAGTVAPLHDAARHGALGAAEALLAFGAPVNATASADGASALHVAVHQGHKELIRPLLKAQANPELQMRGGFTPLALAAGAGRLSCCQLLLESGHGRSALDSVTDTGWTPLHLACKAGQLAVARTLLEHGASMNLPSTRGRTPLMVAVEAQQPELVKLLVLSGADLEKSLPGHWTPLHLACLIPESKHVIQLLLQHHAQLSSTEEGWTPLHLAVQSGDESNVAAVLAAKSGMEPSSKVLSPLHVAAEAGDNRVVQLLLRSGAPPEAVTSHEITALHLAAGAGGSPEPPRAAAVAQVLLSHGAAVDPVMEGGATPLMVASRLGRTAVVQCLLRHGADAQKKLPSGWCSFLLAVRNGHTEVVRLLVKPEHAQVKTPLGRTPIQCAQKYGHRETEELLRSLWEQ